MNGFFLFQVLSFKFQVERNTCQAERSRSPRKALRLRSA